MVEARSNTHYITQTQSGNIFDNSFSLQVFVVMNHTEVKKSHFRMLTFLTEAYLSSEAYH